MAARVRPFEHIHVDRLESAGDSDLAEMNQVFQLVEAASHEYCELRKMGVSSVHRDGFRYLNSERYATLNERLSEIEDEVVHRLGDSRLIRRLQWWRRLTDARESDMLGNIYAHCANITVSNGVFLLGAAHRTGIAQKIVEHCSKEPGVIDWAFYDGRLPE